MSLLENIKLWFKEISYNRWCDKYAIGGGDVDAVVFLKSRGFKLLKGFVWVPPKMGYKFSGRERAAMYYLTSEWDYGYNSDPDFIQNTVITKNGLTSASAGNLPRGVNMGDNMGNSVPNG